MVREATEELAFPGAVYGVLLRNKSQAIEAAGRFTYTPESAMVSPKTIFDVASLSKILATTAMAMLLYQRRQLDLNEPISERLPEFVHDRPGCSPKRAVTTRMLLAHSSGLPAYERLFERSSTASALLSACLRMPLENEPGARTLYSDIGFIVLGHLLETITGEELDRYCAREIFAPLAMNSTLYNPPPVLRSSIPPTAIDATRPSGLLQGEVHDDNCRMLGGVGGQAGVFSNVGDLLCFAECILRGGGPIFEPETVSVFAEPQKSGSGPIRGLGWDMPTAPPSSGRFFSPRSIGHLGYTGTSLWIDREKDLAVALLTNRTFPGNGPEGVSKRIQQVRPRFHDAVMRELGFGSD